MRKDLYAWGKVEGNDDARTWRRRCRWSVGGAGGVSSRHCQLGGLRRLMGVLAPTRRVRRALRGVRRHVGAQLRRGTCRMLRRRCGRVRFARGARAPRARCRAIGRSKCGDYCYAFSRERGDGEGFAAHDVRTLPAMMASSGASNGACGARRAPAAEAS